MILFRFVLVSYPSRYFYITCSSDSAWQRSAVVVRSCYSDWVKESHKIKAVPLRLLLFQCLFCQDLRKTSISQYLSPQCSSLEKTRQRRQYFSFRTICLVIPVFKYKWKSVSLTYRFFHLWSDPFPRSDVLNSSYLKPISVFYSSMKIRSYTHIQQQEIDVFSFLKWQVALSL